MAFKNDEELLDFLKKKYEPELELLNIAACFTIHEGFPGYDPNGDIPFEIKTKFKNSTGTFEFSLNLGEEENEIDKKFQLKKNEINKWAAVIRNVI